MKFFVILKVYVDYFFVNFKGDFFDFFQTLCFTVDETFFKVFLQSTIIKNFYEEVKSIL